MPETLFLQLSRDIKRLHQRTLSLMLATQAEESQPYVSHAPFVALDGVYYVLMADGAVHTRHLQPQPQTGMLLLEDATAHDEDEADSTQMRLSWVVSARILPQQTARYQQVLLALQRRLGQMVGRLKHIQNVNIFELVPQYGRVMVGFTQTYAFSPQDLNRALAESATIGT